MKYTGITYRPPFEAESLLLQVTTGCSHNACSFCTMYRDVPFQVETIEQIEKNIQEAGEFASNTTRVFLENGDPFVLSADRLAEIVNLIHRYLPKVRTIAMYASIKNIQTKTDQDLIRLRSLGINELNIGVESGLDKALVRMNKGFMAQQAAEELKRLKRAGIAFGANVIFGCAGTGKGAENAAATARLLNETQPYLIFTGTIHADPGCPLYEEMRSGSFLESTFGEYLDEEEAFLKELEMENCYYFGLHPSNVVQMHGNLPEDKGRMLEHVKSVRMRLGRRLDQRPFRYGEGVIL